MVEYPVDNHPLRFNAVAVEALLHHGVLGVFALPLLAVELLLPRAVVVRRRLVHVVLALVVPIHDGVIQLQLHEQQSSQKKTKQSALQSFIQRHLCQRLSLRQDWKHIIHQRYWDKCD